MQLEYAKNPVWVNAEHTIIDLTVRFAEIPEDLPFTASPTDVEAHGRAIFAAAQAGDFGPIAEYVPPADITGEDALNAVRGKRNNLLATEVDPIVSNPLRWADLSAEQQQAWADYRRALLDITSAYPNPSYVWNEEKQGYDEVGVVWPVKPV